jgi:hypothetical protein
MSPAECYRLSSAYDFFGLVDGNRCIGFSSLQEAAVAPATDHGACSVPCSGAAGAKCGGKASMQLYARNKPLPQLAPVSGEGCGHAVADEFACRRGGTHTTHTAREHSLQVFYQSYVDFCTCAGALQVCSKTCGGYMPQAAPVHIVQ